MSITPKQHCIQLKGAMLPLTVVEIFKMDLSIIEQEIHAKVSQAPDFFKDLPIIIALEKYDSDTALPFHQLIDLFSSFGIKPVGIRGGDESQQDAARSAGLAILPAHRERPDPHRHSDQSSRADADQKEETTAPKTETPDTENSRSEPTQVLEAPTNRVITQPVRSGQQIYAPGGDLIVLAPVSAGAEILADGNIHVYGRLRGRALAGVKGDEKARLFCQSLEAELVSIAGQYKISEDLQKDSWGKSVQISLNNGKLIVESLSS